MSVQMTLLFWMHSSVRLRTQMLSWLPHARWPWRQVLPPAARVGGRWRGGPW